MLHLLAWLIWRLWITTISHRSIGKEKIAPVVVDGGEHGGEEGEEHHDDEDHHDHARVQGPSPPALMTHPYHLPLLHHLSRLLMMTMQLMLLMMNMTMLLMMIVMKIVSAVVKIIQKITIVEVSLLHIHLLFNFSLMILCATVVPCIVLYSLISLSSVHAWLVLTKNNSNQLLSSLLTTARDWHHFCLCCSIDPHHSTTYWNSI